MKRIWFAVIFITVAFIACVFEQVHIKEFCNRIEAMSDNAIIMLESGDGKGFDNEVKAIQEYWQKENDLLFALSGHVILDELSFKINSLNGKNEAIYDVKAIINAYRENNIIKIANIL